MTARPEVPQSVSGNPEAKGQRVILVTGPGGAGRTTAINALEDLGFEAIDNMPLSLVPRLVGGEALDRPLALGVDVRNRDFSEAAVLGCVNALMAEPDLDLDVLFLDCRVSVLIRRYSETRRRHPLAPDGAPETGIMRELDLLASVRDTADALIDTSEMTPHDLKAEIHRLFGGVAERRMALTISSFSYKRGLPRGVDMVLDCRFLANPHWDADLRALDGRDPRVESYVRQDANYPVFFDNVRNLVQTLLPAYIDEGKSHFSIGFGCTGGRHRSVALTEILARSLAEAGWQVSKRHRELERAAGRRPEATRGVEV